MTELRVPDLGESIVEATIGTWLKNVGDEVAEGEAVVELETDKVNVEVMAESAGVLQNMKYEVGDTVTPGDVLGEVGAGGAQAVSAQKPRGDDSKPTETDETSSPDSSMAPAAPSGTSPDDRGSVASGEHAHASQEQNLTGAGNSNLPPRATPAMRRMALERGVPVEELAGTAAQEPSQARRVQDSAPATTNVSSQVNQAQAPTRAPEKSSTMGEGGRGDLEEHVRLSRRRLTIAKRLVEAQHTAAMLTTFNEIDMSAVMEVRKRRKESFRERHGVGLGYMSFFTKAVVGALKAVPRLNAEIRGEEMILKHYYDIGIAVAAEGGLVVPVVRDADSLSFAEIEQQIATLAKRARDNQLSLQDLSGGTFTITNGGTFGSLLSTPILNPPQVGILGMHKIEERPVGVNGQIELRPMMYVALSYDHRIVDGAEAVRFLVRVKELLEDPEQLWLEG